MSAGSSCGSRRTDPAGVPRFRSRDSLRVLANDRQGARYLFRVYDEEVVLRQLRDHAAQGLGFVVDGLDAGRPEASLTQATRQQPRDLAGLTTTTIVIFLHDHLVETRRETTGFDDVVVASIAGHRDDADASRGGQLQH